MQMMADYRCRPLGSSSWRKASTSSRAWGLGAVGAGSPRTGEYTVATVGSYGVSKSMKLQQRTAELRLSCALITPEGRWVGQRPCYKDA
jgi:hypothetical protein